VEREKMNEYHWFIEKRKKKIYIDTKGKLKNEKIRRELVLNTNLRIFVITEKYYLFSLSSGSYID
jgi:hypothetical protein